jgi:hypothetical protein
MSDNYNETLGIALDSVKETETVQDDGYIHLSSGVVLAPRKINPLVFQQVASQFKDPVVPYVWDEKKQRKEYNPMNPEYLEEKKRVEAERSMATIDAVIALGTKLSSEHPMPPDISSLEDDDWIYDLEAAGLVFDTDNKRMRYRTWVKFIACPEVKDIEILTNKVLKYIGVLEENVGAAVDSFQYKT